MEIAITKATANTVYYIANMLISDRDRVIIFGHMKSFVKQRLNNSTTLILYDIQMAINYFNS